MMTHMYLHESPGHCFRLGVDGYPKDWGEIDRIVDLVDPADLAAQMAVGRIAVDYLRNVDRSVRVILSEADLVFGAHIPRHDAVVIGDLALAA
jgi:hypothetical protein